MFIKSKDHECAIRKDDIVKANIVVQDNTKGWRFYINIPEGIYIEYHLKNSGKSVYMEYESVEEAQEIIAGL